MAQDTSERITALEMHVAHQDRAIEELNATVTDQWRKIDALVAEVLRLTDRIGDLAGRVFGPPEPPPPHY